MLDWRKQCEDPDEWLAPFVDTVSDPPEVKSLVRELLNRRMLPRLKKISTSLRRNSERPGENREGDPGRTAADEV